MYLKLFHKVIRYIYSSHFIKKYFYHPYDNSCCIWLIKTNKQNTPKKLSPKTKATLSHEDY